MDTKNEVFQVIIHLKGGGVEALVQRQYINPDGTPDGPGRVLDGAGSASPILNDRETVVAAQEFVAKHVLPKIAERHGVPIQKMGAIDGVAAVDARIAEENRVAAEKAAAAQAEKKRLEDLEKEADKA